MSSITKFISLLGLVLPSALLIVSFALSLATITSPDWAVAYLFDTTTNTETQLIVFDTTRTQSRSPFWTCNFQGDGTDTAAVPVETCHRYKYPGQTCDINGPDNPHICQQIILSGNLLIASATFFCVAFLASFVVIALGWNSVSARSKDARQGVIAQHEGHGEPKTDGQWTAADTIDAAHDSRRRPSVALPYVTTVATFFAIIATVLMILAQLLGVNALVNDQTPNADYMSQISVSKPGFNSPLDTTIGPWMMGRTSLVWATTAWVSGGIAIFIIHSASQYSRRRL